MGAQTRRHLLYVILRRPFPWSRAMHSLLHQLLANGSLHLPRRHPRTCEQRHQPPLHRKLQRAGLPLLPHRRHLSPPRARIPLRCAPLGMRGLTVLQRRRHHTRGDTHRKPRQADTRRYQRPPTCRPDGRQRKAAQDTQAHRHRRHGMPAHRATDTHRQLFGNGRRHRHTATRQLLHGRTAANEKQRQAAPL